MRSALDVMIAVQDNAPASESELRCCVEYLRTTQHFLKAKLTKLCEAVENHRLESFWAAESRVFLKTLFDANKAPMDKWLGADGIPGSAGQQKSLEWAKRIFEKATGKSFD